MTSCNESGDETIALENGTKSSGFPIETQKNPEVTGNTNIPNIQATPDKYNGTEVIRIDMTGIQDYNDKYKWLKLYGTHEPYQNIWVEVDGEPQGIIVINLADLEQTKVKTDIVFTVDNSSSMKEEANTLAKEIIDWANFLFSNNLDVQFGVVGYGGFVDGAMNLTNAASLSSYLNRSGLSGTSRTVGFDGSDWSILQNYANNFPRTGNTADAYECGAMAIRFADQYFNWRSGSNRVYVNFTDEPNQPRGNQDYSVEFFRSQSNWPAQKGTVHTVFSASYSNSEKPWLISDYTGGTTIYAKPDFSDVTLLNLPVTGALQNSYLIYFLNIEKFKDGKNHIVHITIRDKSGTMADKTFTVRFS